MAEIRIGPEFTKHIVKSMRKKNEEPVKAKDEPLELVRAVTRFARQNRMAMATALNQYEEAIKRLDAFLNKAEKEPNYTEADQHAIAKLTRLRSAVPTWDLVVGERCEIVSKPRVEGTLTSSYFQELGVRKQFEWQPVVPGTVTRLSDGTFAYLFYTGNSCEP